MKNGTVAVYVPELKKWGLFYAPSDIVASFQYNWVTTALHTKYRSTVLD